MEGTKFAMIAAKINPENGEVTLFIENEKWGPIVTGKNLAEAKAKMKEAFEMAMIANSYVDSENLSKKQSLLHQLKRVNNTLEYAL